MAWSDRAKVLLTKKRWHGRAPKHGQPVPHKKQWHGYLVPFLCLFPTPIRSKTGPVRSWVFSVRSGLGPVLDRLGLPSKPSLLFGLRSRPVRSGPRPIYTRIKLSWVYKFQLPFFKLFINTKKQKKKIVEIICSLVKYFS